MKTVVQFAEHCADHYVGGCKAASPDFKIDPAVVVMLVELIGEAIVLLMGACPDTAGPGVLFKAVKEPSLRQRILFRAHVARRCEACCEPELTRVSGKLAQCIQHCASELGVEDVEAIHRDAVDPDYILI